MAETHASLTRLMYSGMVLSCYILSNKYYTSIAFGTWSLCDRLAE